MNSKKKKKVEQVQPYFSVVENLHNPSNEVVDDTKGSRWGQGKSWVGQAEASLQQVHQLTELKPWNGKNAKTDSSTSLIPLVR